MRNIFRIISRFKVAGAIACMAFALFMTFGRPDAGMKEMSRLADDLFDRYNRYCETHAFEAADIEHFKKLKEMEAVIGDPWQVKKTSGKLDGILNPRSGNLRYQAAGETRHTSFTITFNKDGDGVWSMTKLEVDGKVGLVADSQSTDAPGSLSPAQ